MSTQPLMILGVGAGIAAYKAIQLVRLASKAGWQVQVIPTPTALEMVGKKTWEALSGSPVLTDTFDDDEGGVTHIELARKAKAILIAPATADLLARMAHGIANDLLTNVLLASPAPVFVAPAMHTQMWEHPATVDNVALLKKRGVEFIGPTTGDLSSGDSGLGRLVEPEQIWNIFNSKFLTQPENSDPGLNTLPPTTQTSTDAIENTIWSGKNILISAGGTQEPIDPVRFIGNRSSGIFGCALATEFAQRGASVTLLAANVASSILPSHPLIKVEETPTAEKMFRTAKQLFPQTDLLIMAAAVADFRPLNFVEQKIKKQTEQNHYQLELTKNPDILATLAAEKQSNQLVVGFAAETGDWQQVFAYGKAKIAKKKADLILLNQVGMTAGFGDVTTRVVAIDAAGTPRAQWQGTKPEIAKQICDFLRTFDRARGV